MKAAPLLLLFMLAGCSLGSRIDLAQPGAEATYPEPEPSAAQADRFTSSQRLLPVTVVSAPGWSVTVEALGKEHYRLRMKLNALHSGGEGDVRSIVVQTAEAFALERKQAGYEILRIEEGIRSDMFWGTRIAEADFRLYRSAAWPAL